MTENLNKRPRKSILKSSSSFDKPSTASQAQAAAAIEPTAKCTKFDEMNIIETFHPPDKDYGHMKIEEPKTPFRYLEENSETLDAEVLKERISQLNAPLEEEVASPDSESEGGEDECDDGDGDTEEKKVFESKRKAHYNEYAAVKLARKLMEEDEEEDDGGNPSSDKFIPSEEVEIMEEA